MESIESVKSLGLQAIEQANDIEALNQVRVTYLGKKGPVQDLMKQMKDLPNEEKPKFGQMVNDCKQALAKAIEEKQVVLQEKALNEKLEAEKIDLTLDAYNLNLGTVHPIQLVIQAIEDCFVGMGYQVAEGPEVEMDYWNFERANIPADHPARDMQDTFFIDVNRLLRSHTTSIQMRALDKLHDQMPIKLICPGKVYRRDSDATHSHQFTQCEGLVVGENITLTDLKGTLQFMVDALFGKGRTIRFRPSYFPFTEPSVEVDMTCHNCGGKGCPLCKGSGYIEILGGGMVHPHVLEMAGIDSSKYSGFAFGIGLERVAMLKYGINDIRDFYTNDVRFLKNFKRFN